MLERATGKVLAKADISGFPRNATLLPDASGALFLQFNGRPGFDRMLWKFDEDSPRPFCQNNPLLKGELLFPVGVSSLVGISYDTAARKMDLVKADRKTCVVSSSVPADDEDQRAKIGDFRISPDEDLFAYVVTARRNEGKRFVKEIVVRSTDDLLIQKRFFRHEDWHFESFVFSADGKTIAASAYRDLPGHDRIEGVITYDLSSGNLVRVLNTDGGHELALSSDSQLLAVGSKGTREGWKKRVQARVSIYEFQTGRHVASGDYPWIEEPRNNPWVGNIKRIMFSPEGDQVLTTTYDTRIWRVPSLKTVKGIKSSPGTPSEKDR